MFRVFVGMTIILALTLQTSPLVFRLGSGWRVDLALLVVVYFSLFWDIRRAVWIAFITGVCQDAISSEPLGLNALSKSLSAFVVSYLCRPMQAQSLLAQVVAVCLAVLLDTAVRLLIMIALQSHVFALDSVLQTLAQQSALSILLLPALCRGLHALAITLRLPGEGP